MLHTLELNIASKILRIIQLISLTNKKYIEKYFVFSEIFPIFILIELNNNLFFWIFNILYYLYLIVKHIYQTDRNATPGYMLELWREVIEQAENKRNYQRQADISSERIPDPSNDMMRRGAKAGGDTSKKQVSDNPNELVPIPRTNILWGRGNSAPDRKLSLKSKSSLNRRN